MGQEHFEELWRRHENSFVRQARKQARGDLDFAEEALARLRRKLADCEVQQTYEPDKGTWRGWAGKILTNIIHDLQRKRAPQTFRVTKDMLKSLPCDGVPAAVCKRLQVLTGKLYYDEHSFRLKLRKLLDLSEYQSYAHTIVKHALRERREEPLLPETAVSREKPPDETASLDEFGRHVDACLDRLSDLERGVFIMKVLLDWTFARIADYLFEKPDPNLVSGHYYRAKQKMKDCLSRRDIRRET